MAAKAIQSQIEEARKQGEFQGQVLSKLNSLESAVIAFNQSQTSVEARIRTLEADTNATKSTLATLNTEFTHQINVNLPQILKDSDETHKRLHLRMDGYENKQAGLFGGLKVANIIVPAIVGTLTALIIYLLTKGH